MSTYVELFDGTTLEFEDGTPPEVIDRAAKSETNRLQVEQRKATVARDPSEYDPSSPEYQAKYGATSGNSFLQNFNAGMGKTFTDVALGAKQMVGMAPPEAADDKRQLDAALMNTGGGNLGYAAGALALTAPVAMAAGATVPGAALAGGIFGAAQPASSMGERYLNTGRDAGYAAMGQYGIDRLLGRLGSYATRSQPGSVGLTAEGRPVPASTRVAVPENFSAPTPATRATYNRTAQQRAQAEAEAAGFGGANASGQASAGGSISANPNVTVRSQTSPSFGEVGPDPSAGMTTTQTQVLKDAEALGFRVTPGVKTGSRSLQQREAKAESQPWSSGPFFAIKEQNQRTGSRIVAESLGVKGDVVDGRVLSQVDDRIGRVYERVADERIREVKPDEFLTGLAEIEQDTAQLLKNNASISDHPLVNQLLSNVAEGKVSGKVAQQMSSKLGRTATRELRSSDGDRELGLALLRVKDLADDILAQGLTPETAAAFKTARAQYRTLKLVEASNVTNASSGNVSLANLAQLLARVDKKGFMYGRNKSDLYAAARFAQAFRPIVGDSGTATRMPVSTTLMDVAVGVPVNIAARAYTSQTATAAAGAAARGAANAKQSFNPFVQGLDNSLAVIGKNAEPYLYPGAINALYERRR